MTEPAEFTYRRIHRATRELLFDCLTQPEHLAHFWGPDGTTTSAGGITVDLRPGGAFETVMVNASDGSQYTMRAVYVEVRRPEKLVWTEPGVEGGMTTTFDKREDGFEKKFAHDEELRFKASARRNKLLGMWAAEKMGLTGAQAEVYAKEVVMADFEEAGDHDVFRKIRKDLDGKKVAVSDQDIKAAMDELMAQAIAQIKASG